MERKNKITIEDKDYYVELTSRLSGTQRSKTKLDDRTGMVTYELDGDFTWNPLYYTGDLPLIETHKCILHYPDNTKFELLHCTIQKERILFQLMKVL